MSRMRVIDESGKCNTTAVENVCAPRSHLMSGCADNFVGRKWESFIAQVCVQHLLKDFAAAQEKPQMTDQVPVICQHLTFGPMQII